MKIKKIGITGGIGSGKTTVCKIFETLGIPVYYADERAKWLMTHDAALKNGIQQLFGEAAYTKEGALNRPYIAQLAFNNPEKLQQLNALVHPAVFRDQEQWHESQLNVPYTLKEAALIYESGSDKDLDKVIVVTAPVDLRVQRVMERDGITREAIEARLKQQMPEEEKLKRADFVIHNDMEWSLIPQVLAIHNQLLAV
ncbi:MAG: dephospho-CoA kinase [Saprospiraceae bacterium]